MAITKDKVKKTAILGTVSGAGLEYVSAAAVQSVVYLKNYQFEQFWETINYNLGHPIANISNALSVDMYTNIQPFVLGASLFIAGKFLLNKPVKYEDASDHGAYGTARFATQSEIFNPDNITRDMKKTGTILGVYGGKTIIQHVESFLNFNHLIVGGSGAGKTVSNVIPNILKNKEKSIVVIDPKGELYEMTSQIKREQGYEVHLVNFKDRYKSDRYNLFHYIRTDSDAFKVADSMVSNAAEGTKVKKDFWNQAQASVLQAPDSLRQTRITSRTATYG
ncbi:type IV secretory pathway TraG/TraD family ATPase VirD4 [Peribacillus simplex]|uniref:type IV secretory system conjugative DNA transfer family protein n=1 Tax=Peribacillus simplex TaxID=1478 RepID=UPI0024E1E4DC|nr:type IV secretory system conjugative DNA transfer family protein [Peribacillus simplex]MDF9763793.1 type IV secretory pathway TraG/TraD family ATPase VirD4 [Peribacillus simplex]